MFLPTINKLVYSYRVKNPCFGIQWTLENIFFFFFCILLVVEVFSLQKVVEMLKEVVVGWWKVRWMWQMRQNVIAQFIRLWKHWLCEVAGHWCGELGPSVGQCQVQALQLSGHLISLLAILFSVIPLSFTGDLESCSGSYRQQITKQGPWPFIGASLAMGSYLELLLSLATELVTTGCHIKSTFHHTSQSIWEIVHCCCIE